MNQAMQILEHLKRAPITAIEALGLYSCFRLAARIHDLRAAGHKIETREIRNGDKRYAQYYLEV